MAIDQRDVSSTLRFMDDRALQQYAAMHKNDPYIFPLAFQESQNRQKIRMSQQTAQGMQPQPKVNDQALAQMAPPQAQPMPEEQGIGALPVGNMETMADGGIAGYPDDDFVTRNQSVVMMAGGGIARYNGAQGSVTASSELQNLLAARERYVQAGADTSGIDQAIAFLQAKPGRAAAQRAAADSAPPAQMPGFAEQMAQDIAPPMPVTAQATMPTPGYTRPGMKDDLRLNTPPTQPVVAAPKPDAGRKDTGRKDTGRKDTGAVAEAGLAGLKDPAKLYQDILDKQDYKDPASGALLELEARERANAAAERQAVVTDAERFKDVYKNREGRLAEREADIGKQRTQNTGLALLNAGLAIMSTPGGLATAIGKGAQVGTAQFAAGLDKIRSAQDRLADARDRLDDLKLNREETTAKELRAAERNYRDVATNAQKRTIDGIRTAAGVNRADAKNIYDKTIDVQKTMYEQGEQTKRNERAIAASNRTPAEIQMVERIMKEKNIPFSEALATLTATKREPVSMEKLRGDWLDMAKKTQIQADYPNIKTFEDYVAVFGGGAGGGGGAGDFKLVGVRPAK
jgi:hypothetical protein